MNIKIMQNVNVSVATHRINDFVSGVNETQGM